MTGVFAFDELTWPEVQALPRYTPLVIPLGTGYNLQNLAEALQNPDRIGLLPSFPFGWQGSGLPLPEQIITVYLNNLLDSLRDDGFTQVYVLAPQAVNLGLGAACIAQPVSPQPPFFSDNDRNKVVILPVGHIEQHAYHLPLSTDTLIIDAIAQEVARLIPDHSLTLPVMPYGVSTHRKSFAGTLNAGGRAFEDFWLAVIERLVTLGFNRFYLVSGHGGNSSFLVNIVKYAGERHRQIFCATAWLYLSGPNGVAALEKYRQSAIGGMGHACELETSLILHLRPELVHMDRVVDEIDFITTPSYYMDWVEGGALVANPPWDDDTATGAYGAGSLATAEHGKLWLEAAVAEKVTHIAEIHEQYTRRLERRQAGFGLWGKNT
jgi:creatinine amidohydrolase